MLFDMVPVSDVIITPEMWAHYKFKVDYALKTWDDYFAVTKDPVKYKDPEDNREYYLNLILMN